MSKTLKVDMSAQAVSRRLQETSDLLRLGKILMQGKDLGPVESPKVAEAAERKLRRENKKWLDARKVNSKQLSSPVTPLNSQSGTQPSSKRKRANASVSRTRD